MKIKGFTLLEMLLVMALTGLAIAIAWSTWTNFELFGMEYRKRNHDQAVWRRLDHALRLDSHRADDLALKGDSLIFKGGTWYLRFDEGMVRHFAGVADSFYYPIGEIRIDSLTGSKRVQLSLLYGQQISYPIRKKASARLTQTNDKLP